jgi:predicted nucleic acid-binding protein
MPDRDVGSCGEKRDLEQAAAAALAHDLTVVTLNQRDFEPARTRLVDPSI